MQTKRCKLLFTGLIVGFFLSLTAFLMANAQPFSGEADLHIKNGMKYFNRAFYELTPKKKKMEAAQSFDLAVAEFKRAVAIDTNSIEAHRNLARIFHFQKKHLQAAEHYRKVTAINPRDLDMYVLTALSYLEIDRYDEALERLVTAKTYTVNEKILEKLNGYIEKVEQEMAAK